MVEQVEEVRAKLEAGRLANRPALEQRESCLRARDGRAIRQVDRALPNLRVARLVGGRPVRAGIKLKDWRYSDAIQKDQCRTDRRRR